MVVRLCGGVSTAACQRLRDRVCPWRDETVSFSVG
jgi:hypothetical protein